MLPLRRSPALQPKATSEIARDLRTFVLDGAAPQYAVKLLAVAAELEAAARTASDD